MGTDIEHINVKKDFIEELSKKIDVHQYYYRNINKDGSQQYSIKIVFEMIDKAIVYKEECLIESNNIKVEIESYKNKLIKRLVNNIIKELCQ